MPAIIVLNKVDAGSWRSEECRDELETWRKLGYATAEVSAHTGIGLDALGESLRNHTSLLVGQSGVGKSSILNALAPAAAAQIREIVTKTGKGSHTTTRTALYKLRGGGELLDSPWRPGLRARGPISCTTPSTDLWKSPRQPLAAALQIAGTTPSPAVPCTQRSSPATSTNAAIAALRSCATSSTADLSPARLLAGLGVQSQVSGCRPAMACASVPPSTYSSSPPTGTPCAMRLTRSLRLAASSATKCAVASPSTVGLVARITSLAGPAPRSAPRAGRCRVPRADAVERRQVTHQHEVQAAETRGLFEREHVGGRFDDT